MAIKPNCHCPPPEKANLCRFWCHTLHEKEKSRTWKLKSWTLNLGLSGSNSAPTGIEPELLTPMTKKEDASWFLQPGRQGWRRIWEVCAVDLIENNTHLSSLCSQSRIMLSQWNRSLGEWTWVYTQLCRGGGGRGRGERRQGAGHGEDCSLFR